MQKLVTVFGGSGFVGRYVVRALAKDGWRIRVAVRRPHLAGDLRVMGDVGQVEIVQANVRSAASVEAAVAGADAVVDLVGVLFSKGAQSFKALHLDAARIIAEAAAKAGAKKLVHVSALGADPDSASAYARTKAEGEAAVRAAFPKAVIVRPSIVFGAEDNFFNKFAGMAAMAPALPLIGGGKTLFQPIYAGDVGSSIAAVLNLPAPAPLYEIGGPQVYSFKALMELVAKETMRKPALLPIPFGIASLIGLAGDIQAAVLPIAPPLTRDQVAMLRSDNVAASGAPGLKALGVQPTALEGVLPTYLWRFRKNGQFAVPLGADV
jgi:NADH dehydrogenase